MSVAAPKQRSRGAARARPGKAMAGRYCATDRDALIERHLPLARRLARRYARTEDMAEELRQVAALGLIKAVDRFDPGRGTPFAGFATPTILGELKRHLRDNRWAVHVPRDLQELAQKIARETDRLTPQLGRSPSIREVAQSLGIDVEQAIEARAALSGMDASSLDSPASADGEGDDAVVDRLGREDEGYDLVEDRELVLDALGHLPERQRMALRLRFDEAMTQAEIGQVLGVSQMQVSRMLRRSIERLRVLTQAAA